MCQCAAIELVTAPSRVYFWVMRGGNLMPSSLFMAMAIGSRFEDVGEGQGGGAWPFGPV